MTKDEILNMLKTLKPELMARHKVKEIGLFGSFVRGHEGSTSDIDVLVELEEGGDLFDLVGVGLFLEEHLERKVDVVEKSGLRSQLRDAVLKEVVAV